MQNNNNPIDDAVFDEILKTSGVQAKAPEVDPWADFTPLKTEPTLGSKIAERYSNVKKIASKPATGIGGELEGGLQTAGELAGGFNETVDSVIDPVVTPVVETALRDSPLNVMGSGIKKAFDNDIVKKGAELIKKGADKFIPENIKKDLKAGKEIGEAVLTATGVGAVGKSVVKSAGKVAAKKVAEKAAGKVAGDLLPKVDKGLLDMIRTSPDNMTKGQLKEAVEAGRQIEVKNPITRTTTVDYKPTEPESRAALILDKVLSPKTPKGKILSTVNAKISELGIGAETYLKKAPKLIPQQLRDAQLFTLRKEAAESLTKTEMRYYDDQINLFRKQLAKQPANTYGWYKAIKDWETKVGETLPRGKEALLGDVTASAKVRAAKDIRSSVRKVISDSHPDFKEKMFDLMSLYEVKPAIIENAAKNKSSTIFTRNPKKTKAAATIIGATGAGALGTGAFNALSN